MGAETAVKHQKQARLRRATNAMAQAEQMIGAVSGLIARRMPDPDTSQIDYMQRRIRVALEILKYEIEQYIEALGEEINLAQQALEENEDVHGVDESV